MSKTRIEEIKNRFIAPRYGAKNFDGSNIDQSAIDIAYLLQEIDRLNGKLEFAKKSLRFYSKKEYDRVCFLDHATCEEHYGADARETLKELESE